MSYSFNNLRYYRQKWNRSIILCFCIFPVFNIGFTLAFLQPAGKVEPDMLTIWDKSSANISRSSFSILQGISGFSGSTFTVILKTYALFVNLDLQESYGIFRAE